MGSGERKRRVLVIGAGPVGSLTALSFHKQGWEVEVWDTRDGELLCGLWYVGNAEWRLGVGKWSLHRRALGGVPR